MEIIKGQKSKVKGQKPKLLPFAFCVLSFFCTTFSITLKELLTEVEERNLELKAVNQEYQAAKAQITIEKTWEQPQAGLEIMKPEMGDNEYTYSLSQMIPFLPRPYLKARIAQKDAEAVRERLSAKRLSVRAQAKSAYWTYYALTKTLRLLEENLIVLRQISQIARVQYSLGRVSQVDPLKAELEIGNLENQIRALKQEIVVQVAQINALRNQPLDKQLGEPEELKIIDLKISPVALFDSALKYSPEIRIPKLVLQKKELELKLVKSEWFPDLMTTLKYSNMRNKGVMAQVSVPLYYKKPTKMIEKMRQEREMAQLELEQMKVEVDKMIRIESDCCKNLRVSIENFEKNLIPLAAQTFEASLAAYRVQKNSFLDLLDSQMRYLDTMMGYYEMIAEYSRTLAELEAVVGVDFE